MSGGLDQPIISRIQGQNMAFVVDRQGTTQAAVQADGLRNGNVAYFGRNAFGRLEGGVAGSTNTETGFTGASTPNQTGGFTYLRNRWYDPATGRFLTQDPIRLAGGENLYAYAGNNPIMFTDPFGLCAAGGGGDSTKVEVCSSVADIPFNGLLGLKHIWIRTGSKEAGLGQAGGGVPGEGDYESANNSPFVTMTEVTNHAGRGSQPGASCKPATADAGCVNSQLKVGEQRGRWSPTNQCQTFVNSVIRSCQVAPTTVARDNTNVAESKPRKE